MGDEYIRDIANGTEKRVIHGDTRIVGSLEVTGTLTNNSEPVDGEAVPVVVLRKTVTLTDAQIKALPTTPFEIIAAQGAGKIIRWLGAWIVLNNSAGGYVAIGLPILQLCYLVSPSVIEASGFVDVLGTLPVAGIHSAPIPPLSSFNDAESYLSWGPTDTGDLIVNAGLGIGDIYNGLADYTGGNAANTLKVTVLYTIVDA